MKNILHELVEENSVMLRGILLDLDGTLLDSNDAHADAWVEALAAFGYDVPFDRVRPLIGMGGDKLIDRIVPGLTTHAGVGKEISECRRQILNERYMDSLEPTPGARDLVLRLHRDGFRTAIATSSKSDELEALMKRARISDLIEHKTTSDEISEPKPAPNTVRTAREQLGLQPGEVLMIGDTRYDVESSGQDNVAMIGLLCGGSSADDLYGCVAIYASPADLLAHYDASPIGRAATLSAR